ncbi:MAG TPA: alpha/beta hydrolase [Clostridia bacterium]|jgi:pimeloyl-ACP methyl ester carboxylesterase|nr:alpha/beta hydrolase [Clostridiaceae bacterium]HOT70940.1 alpha/beta hydrolase [Clostridia bacterium]HQH66054.1 alpha/beta hydrolase [Clostridia bacterium]HQJ92849.1 alpha/beta hydrolase [Clostridia bacterium]
MRWLKFIMLFFIFSIALLIVFAYRNFHYDYGNDRFMENKGTEIGFREQIYKTKDGSEIAYLEGPDNGEPLLLIHGQMVSKEDYAKVLPELSKHFHIFAVDCYGHGNSSKDPTKYNILSIRDDMILFMHDVIKEKTFLSGHSSGALISSAIAAKNKEQVKGLLLEDGPFFSTEPGRAEKTFSYLDFKTIHDFLLQSDEKNYTKYFLEHTYLKEVFNKDGKDNWSFLVKNPFTKRIKVNSEKMPIVWYYPPEIGLNGLVFLTRNMQDGTGMYDLRFGNTFYDFSWFEGFDQRGALSEIECPTIILHVAPSKETAPGYYDENGILLSAMDEKDAKEVQSLIEGSILMSGYESDHNIHADLPEQFIEAILEMKRKD